jgi:hypothetical protein
MDDAILRALTRRVPEPPEAADSYRGLPELVGLGSDVACRRGPLEADRECHTAFHMLFSSSGERWALAAEFSKMGLFAKAYWTRHGLLGGSHYRYEPPSEFWRRKRHEVEQKLAGFGIEVLTGAELGERLPATHTFPTPVGEAVFVDQVLFHFDGALAQPGARSRSGDAGAICEESALRPVPGRYNRTRSGARAQGRSVRAGGPSLPMAGAMRCHSLTGARDVACTAQACAGAPRRDP